MAIIYSYPLVSSLDSSNLFPLTATNEEDELYVANVQFSTLASEISKAISGTDNVLAKFSSAGLVDSSITDDGSTVSMPMSRTLVIGTSTVSGSSSVAFGESHTINQNYCFAAGQQHTLTGANDASALGFGNTASGAQSLATGSNTVASGPEATSFGLNTTASGARAVAAGFNTVASGENSFVVGKWNLGGSNIFEVGIGTSDAARKNAIAVDGNTQEVFFDASAVIINQTDAAGADLRVGGVAVVDSILSVGGALTLNNSNVTQTNSQLDFFVGPLTDSMLQLNASPGDWSFRIGEQTSLTTITGASGSGNIDITSSGATMARFNGLTPTNSFIRLGGSGAANTLDDYEEGSFNPTFTAGSGSGTLSVDFYNLQSGNYVKVGKKVTCIIGVATNQSTVSGTAALQISGLPFTIESTDMNLLGGNLSNGSQIANVANVTAVDRGDNNTSIVFRYNNGAPSNDSFITLNISDLQGSGEYIKVLITYFTTQ